MTFPPLLLGAGGRSRRMGRPKHLLEVDGRSLLEWQLERFRAAGGRNAVVVLPEGDTTSPRETRIAGLEITWLTQPDPDAPMADSLRRAAVAALVLDPAAAWWLPVDTPAPAPEDWADLLEGLVPGVEAVTPAGGGHPVLLARTLLETVAAAGPELRLDLLLVHLAAGGRTVQVEAHDGARRINLNTPEAWEAWLAAAQAPRERL